VISGTVAPSRRFFDKRPALRAGLVVGKSVYRFFFGFFCSFFIAVPLDIATSITYPAPARCV
jgi:hypothetical protein